MPKLSVPRRGSSYYPASKNIALHTVYAKYPTTDYACEESAHKKECNVRVRRYKLFHLMQRFLLRIKLKD